MAKVKKMAAVPQVKESDMLTSQYEKVESAKGAFVREAVRFGAMLIEVESSILPRQNANNKANGNRYTGGREGLETWLSENCPAINYKTAMSYKSMAVKFSAMLGGGEVAVAALVENSGGKKAKDEVIDIPAEVVEKRDALFEEVDSRRKLEQAYFEFMAADSGGVETRGKVGRPKAEAVPVPKLEQMYFEFAYGKGGKVGRPKAEAAPIPKLKASDEAAAIWTGVMRVLDKSAVMDTVPLLDEKATVVCFGRLGDLYKALKKHLEEF